MNKKLTTLVLALVFTLPTILLPMNHAQKAIDALLVDEDDAVAALLSDEYESISAFICPVCNKRLTRKSNLITHMHIHSGERPFVCDKCSKTFTLKSNLKKHMRTHNK